MAKKVSTKKPETSKVRNGTKRPDKQPALRVVQPPSPPITPRIEVDFKHLDDGRVVELVEDPADATKTKFAVFDGGKVYLTDAVDYRGQILVPIVRTTHGLEDIILPVRPVRMSQPRSVQPDAQPDRGLRRHSEQYLYVTAAFVLNSWFADRLRPPVYLLADRTAAIGENHTARDDAIALSPAPVGLRHYLGGRLRHLQPLQQHPIDRRKRVARRSK